jgi:hypothetical protein
MHKKSVLFTATLLIFYAGSVAFAEEGIPHTPKELVLLPSPKADLVAITRSPIPDTELPDFSDADGTLLFIRGPERGSRIIAHRFFAGRFISKMLWSPDGQFLVMGSESAGGHSPWHFNAYFWSHADGKFRPIDYATGPVVSDEFVFTSSHTLHVKIAGPDPKGGLDFEHPITKTVDLDQLRHTVPKLKSCPWP